MRVEGTKVRVRTTTVESREEKRREVRASRREIGGTSVAAQRRIRGRARIVLRGGNEYIKERGRSVDAERRASKHALTPRESKSGTNTDDDTNTNTKTDNRRLNSDTRVR